MNSSLPACANLTYFYRSPQLEEQPKAETQDAQMQDATSPTAETAAGTRKRPRLDLTADPRERKRGKTMFGLVLGTLNKAKLEDSQRNNSEAVCGLMGHGPERGCTDFA